MTSTPTITPPTASPEPAARADEVSRRLHRAYVRARLEDTLRGVIADGLYVRPSEIDPLLSDTPLARSAQAEIDAVADLVVAELTARLTVMLAAADEIGATTRPSEPHFSDWS